MTISSSIQNFTMNGFRIDIRGYLYSRFTLVWPLDMYSILSSLIKWSLTSMSILTAYCSHKARFDFLPSILTLVFFCKLLGGLGCVFSLRNKSQIRLFDPHNQQVSASINHVMRCNTILSSWWRFLKYLLVFCLFVQNRPKKITAVFFLVKWWEGEDLLMMSIKQKGRNIPKPSRVMIFKKDGLLFLDVGIT